MAEPHQDYDDDVVVISKEKLNDLLESSRKTAQRVSEISGGLGKKIAAAIENDHLHRKAFNVTKMADNLAPENLVEFLAQMDRYLVISGLRARAAKVGRLPLNDDAKADAAAAKAAGKKKTKAAKAKVPAKKPRAKKPGTGVTSSFGRQLRAIEGGMSGEGPQKEAAE